MELQEIQSRARQWIDVMFNQFNLMFRNVKEV